jgi:hypothetical protein
MQLLRPNLYYQSNRRAKNTTDRVRCCNITIKNLLTDGFSTNNSLVFPLPSPGFLSKMTGEQHNFVNYYNIGTNRANFWQPGPAAVAIVKKPHIWSPNERCRGDFSRSNFWPDTSLAMKNHSQAGLGKQRA